MRDAADAPVGRRHHKSFPHRSDPLGRSSAAITDEYVRRCRQGWRQKQSPPAPARSGLVANSSAGLSIRWSFAVVTVVLFWLWAPLGVGAPKSKVNEIFK